MRDFSLSKIDQSKAKGCILIVDDDTGYLELMTDMVSSLGYSTETASDGREAVDLLKKGAKFSTLITDISMPRMDGMELLCHLRKHYPDIEVIVVTGFHADYGFSDVISAGATDYLEKPFGIDELSAKLNRVFREQRLIRALKYEIRNHEQTGKRLKIVRKQAEEAHKRALDDLESRVAERTAELAAANETMAREIIERKLTEEALRKSEADLETRKVALEETNTALKVLLEKLERDRGELETQVVSNVKEFIEPYLDILKESGLVGRQKTYIEILESNLNDIISPFAHSSLVMNWKFTPAEMKVANLVRFGKSTKEIAEIMNLSPETVSVHRKKIRKKSGVTNKKINLHTVLTSLKPDYE